MKQNSDPRCALPSMCLAKGQGLCRHCRNASNADAAGVPYDPSRGMIRREIKSDPSRQFEDGPALAPTFCKKCGNQKVVHKAGRTKDGAQNYTYTCRVCHAVRSAERRKRGYKVRHDRMKKLAQWSAQRAIKRGKLVRQPCERCGATEHIHAHHDDYSRRHDVKWFCPVHHKERHRELAAAEEGRGLSNV
jgi:hypothetical protein